MHSQGRIWFVPAQDFPDAFAACWEKELIVVQKCYPAGFMLVICHAMFVCRWKSWRLRPIIKCDRSLSTIWSQRVLVLIRAVVVIKIEVFESDDLMKLNPF